MALATRCPNCHALFRVAADQLKLRGGLVRCGACRHVFDATGTLSYIDDAALSTTPHAAEPAVGAVIAAIRKAESTANESLPAHDVEPHPSGPSSVGPASHAEPASHVPSPERESDAELRTEADATVAAEGLAEGVLASGGPAGLPEETGVATPAVVATIVRPGEQEHPETAAATDEPAEAEPAAPAFLQRADIPSRRGRTTLFGIGAILLAALVLAQLAVAFRADLLAKFPHARPALEGLCRVFRCTVDWPSRGELLAVVGSELQALPGTGAFELTAVVRNRGNTTLALPAIELTLTDTLNRTIARRVFLPADYLAGDREPQAQVRAGLEAGADLTVRIAFEADDGVNAAGFVVYPFYL